MIPNTVTFKEIQNWDALCISNFDTLYRLNHSIFKKHPNICCQHKYAEWVENINSNPQLKAMFKAEYDRIIDLHTKYTFKIIGIKNIRNIGFVNFGFISEEMCEQLIKLYGDTYVVKNIDYTPANIDSNNVLSTNNDIHTGETIIANTTSKPKRNRNKKR